MAKEIKKIGKVTQFEFKPLSHYEIGKKLNLPGQSRNYGRWIKKESIIK